MSTKVYNAVYVPSKKIGEFQTEMMKWAQEALKHRLWGSDDLPEEEFAKLRSYWTARTAEVMTTQRSMTDVMFSFGCLPKGSGLILIPSIGDGLRYASQVAKLISYEDKMKSLDYVKDFSYWDNSDPPDDMPAAEWRKRRAFYRSAFYGENRTSLLDFPLKLEIIEPGIENLFRIDPLYKTNGLQTFLFYRSKEKAAKANK